MINPVNQNKIFWNRGAHINYLRQSSNTSCHNSCTPSFGITNIINEECLPENTRTSIFYVNDYHGKATNMERTITASNMFDRFEPQNPTDKLKLSSGDIMLGEDVGINSVAMKFLKFIGVTATAVGNHECDMPSKDFIKELESMPARLLACNIKSAPDSEIMKKIEKSYIQEINGTKYGIIGTIPSDLSSRIKYGKAFQTEQIEPYDIKGTIASVQEEIDNLKAQGIDKIILLSHSGYSYDTEIAKNTEGLDVIIGGHSHNLLKGIKKDENLFYSKNGEPVIITQAGRDGKNFGILNLEFDKDGIITKAQNNIANTRDFPKNLVAKNIFESITGKPEVIGIIRTASPILENDLLDVNPLGYYGADAIKEKAGADIGFVMAANIRGYLEEGEVDTVAVEEISPFKNKIVKINYSEKELVDAIKFCAKSFTTEDNKPGLMYTSGLNYTVTKDGKVLNISFVDKNGKENPIDIKNPREDKFYSVAINDYASSGNDGLSMLNKYAQAIEKYDWDVCTAIGDKIRKSPQPIDMIDDGRIKIIAS